MTVATVFAICGALLLVSALLAFNVQRGHHAATFNTATAAAGASH